MRTVELREENYVIDDKHKSKSRKIREFKKQAEMTPEQWLEHDYFRRFPDTLDNNLLRMRARWIELDFS